jgi:hypothetical protein
VRGSGGGWGGAQASMLEEARAPGCAGAGLGAGSRMVATLRACVTNGAILRTHGERRREQGGHLFGLVLG